MKLLFSLIFFAGTAHAAPSITEITGTFSGQAHDATANVATITGTGFGTKSTAKPIIWAPFGSDINPSELGVKTAWDGTTNMAFDADEGFDGNGCAKGTAGEGDWTLRVNESNWNDNGDKAYVFRRVKRNFSITFGEADHNLKPFRMWPSGGSGFPNAYWSINNGRFFVEGVDGSGEWFGSAGDAMGTGWRYEEIIFTAQSSNFATDGRMVWRVNGDEEFDSTTAYNDSGDSDKLAVMYPAHCVAANTGSWEGGWNSSNNYWADDIYVDESHARVMMGNASTLASSTKLTPLIPAAWGSTEVSVYFHQADFANESTAYVFVVDSSGSASSGFEIEIGDTVGSPQEVVAGNGGRSGDYVVDQNLKSLGYICPC